MRYLRIVLLVFMAALFALAHVFFLRTFLYWEYDLLDVVMHIWGGALVVAAWYEGQVLSVWRFVPTKLSPLVVLFVVAILWEIFKYSIGGTVANNYAFDTVTDILAGLCGGLAIFYLYRSRTIGS